MASSFRLMFLSIIVLLTIGGALAYYGYQSSIYPIDVATGDLDRAESAGTPQDMAQFVTHAKRLLPESGNPVWAFPTPRSDFGLIQAQLDAVISRSNSISTLEPHSSAYNTGMSDMRESINVMKLDLVDIMPYLYVSSTNLMYSFIWAAVILVIFVVMRRGRAKYREELETQ
ncbi:MAG: hypothetical protein ABI361_06680 [Nitrososphaera sp.]